MTDSNVTARDAWLAVSRSRVDAVTFRRVMTGDGRACFMGRRPATAAATSARGHLWRNDHVGMFYKAFPFNEDKAGDTSGVTIWFFSASAFNQDIGAWDTSGVTTI